MFDLENKSIYVSKVKLSTYSFSRNVFVYPNIKLCLVNKGSAVWQIEDHLVEVKEGDVVILNNRMKRVFKDVSASTGIELLVIEFDPQLVMNPFWGMLYRNDIEKNNVISGHKEMISLFQEIEAERQKKSPLYRLVIAAKLTEILVLMTRHFGLAEKSNVKIGSDIYHVLEYIDKHYQNNVSQREVADLINMSTSGFSRYFTKCMGIGFAEYIMQKRIQRAIHMLQDSDKTVLEIAFDCGFNNTASFYKAFKKITKLNPGDYRSADSEQVSV